MRHNIVKYFRCVHSNPARYMTSEPFKIYDLKTLPVSVLVAGKICSSYDLVHQVGYLLPSMPTQAPHRHRCCTAGSTYARNHAALCGYRARHIQSSELVTMAGIRDAERAATAHSCQFMQHSAGTVQDTLKLRACHNGRHTRRRASCNRKQLPKCTWRSTCAGCRPCCGKARAGSWRARCQ